MKIEYRKVDEARKAGSVRGNMRKLGTQNHNLLHIIYLKFYGSGRTRHRPARVGTVGQDRAGVGRTGQKWAGVGRSGQNPPVPDFGMKPYFRIILIL